MRDGGETVRWWWTRKAAGVSGPNGHISNREAYQRGRSDGRDRAYLTVFSEQRDFEPPFISTIHARFAAELQKIDQQRRVALAAILEEDVNSEQILKDEGVSILKLNAIIEDRREEHLDLSQTIHAQLSSGEEKNGKPQGLTPQEARRLRLMRQQRAAEELRGEAIDRAKKANRSLESALGRWHDCHAHHVAEAHQARSRAVELINQYTAGLLATHPRKNEISAAWSPSMPVVDAAWLAEQPDARYHQDQRGNLQRLFHEVMRTVLTNQRPPEINSPNENEEAKEETT